MNRQTVYLVVATLFLVLLYLGFRYLLPLVLPFAFGAFLALMLEPAVCFLQCKARLPRFLATGITILSAVGISGLVLVMLTASVAVDVRDISYQLPVYSSTMVKTIQDWAIETQAFYVRLPEPLLQTAEEGVRQLYNIAGTILGKLLGSLKALPNLLLSLFLSFVAAYFISRDRSQLSATVRRLFPLESVERLRTLGQEVTNSLIGLVWAQLILVTITTLVAMAGLWLLGVRYPVFIGLMSGLLDIVPVLGPSLIFLPWVVFALVSGHAALAIGLLAVYLAMNIVRQLLQAKIIGSRTGLHPLAVLVSLYVGIRLFGANGIIVGPLMVIIFRSLIRIGIFGDLTKM